MNKRNYISPLRYAESCCFLDDRNACVLNKNRYFQFLDPCCFTEHHLLISKPAEPTFQDPLNL